MSNHQLKLIIVSAISLVLVLAHQNRILSQSSTTVLKPQSCMSEARLRSKSSVFSTNIQFINRKPFRVKAYWIDFEGKRQHYFDLEPNQVRWQQTYTTHPWVITSSGNNQPCLSIFLPPFLMEGIVIID